MPWKLSNMFLTLSQPKLRENSELPVKKKTKTIKDLLVSNLHYIKTFVDVVKNMQPRRVIWFFIKPDLTSQY